ncbi:MAG: hypothetical protein ACRCV5_02650 [Afipia sp.]
MNTLQLWHHESTDTLVIVQQTKAETVVFNPAGEEVWIGQPTETLKLQENDEWVLEVEIDLDMKPDFDPKNF